MPAPVRTPRTEWIDAGLRALAAGGPDAVRIEPLAQELGVTRGGFYWHFESRRAFLEAMLDTWERRSTDETLERVEREGGDARDRVRRAGMLTFSRELLPVDLNRRMEYLRSLIGTICPDADDVEARSLLAFSLAIGNHFIAADHGRGSRSKVLDAAMERLLA